MNYFFKVVVPQMLEYFKENANAVPNLLILDVLKTEENQEDIDEVIAKANEITDKYKNNDERSDDNADNQK